MNHELSATQHKLIFIGQLFSIAFAWVFVASLTYWVIHLILLSIENKDAPGISISISIIAIPVFTTLIGVLTYVFVGLKKEEYRIKKSNERE